MKFKIGDWIRSKDGLDTAKVTNSTMEFYKEGFDIALEDEWELWQPQEGEWCWYGFEIVQVIDVKASHIKICRQMSDTYEEISSNNLEPFIGELPSFIKE